MKLSIVNNKTRVLTHHGEVFYPVDASIGTFGDTIRIYAEDFQYHVKFENLIDNLDTSNVQDYLNTIINNGFFADSDNISIEEKFESISTNLIIGQNIINTNLDRIDSYQVIKDNIDIKIGLNIQIINSDIIITTNKSISNVFIKVSMI